MTFSVIRSQVQPPADLGFGSLPLPVVEKSYESEQDVSVGVSLVNLQRLERCRTSLRKRIGRSEHAKETLQGVDRGEGDKRPSICRVRVDGLPREFNPLPKSLRGALIGKVSPFLGKVPASGYIRRS